MGNIVPGTTRKWHVVEHDPTTWSLEHVEAIWRRHVAGAHGFGLEKAELQEIIRAVLPDARRDVVEDALWPRFAEYDSGGEVNALEVLGGCAVRAERKRPSRCSLVQAFGHAFKEDVQRRRNRPKRSSSLRGSVGDRVQRDEDHLRRFLRRWTAGAVLFKEHAPPGPTNKVGRRRS